MATNKLTEVAGLVAQAVMGAKVKDKDGNAKTVKPTGDDNLLDLTDITAGGSTGGNTGGGTDPNYPAAGADYYPGSVYDGTISGRTLLYSGAASTTGKTNIVFPESVGAGLRLLGDGIQLRISIVKTLITRGVTGDISNLPVVYDIQDKEVAGKFVTTSPVPISNKKEDLLTGNELVNPLKGIGEGEQSAEIKAPELHVQYNSKTNSIDVWGVQGYALDNLSDTKTGSLYDVQVTLINSFYVQDAVPQLPVDMSLFTGDTSGEIILSGTNNYFDNVGDMLRIDLENYLYINRHDPTTTKKDETWRSLLSNFGIPDHLTISKNDLINGYSVPLNVNIPSSIFKISVQTQSTYDGNTTWDDTTFNPLQPVPVTVTSPSFLIKGPSITPQLKITYKTPVKNDNSLMVVYTGTLRVTSIKTAKVGE